MKGSSSTQAHVDSLENRPSHRTHGCRPPASFHTRRNPLPNVGRYDWRDDELTGTLDLDDEEEDDEENEEDDEEMEDQKSDAFLLL